MSSSNVRRMPKRFLDSGAPPEIADIYDQPEFGDRFTVVYRSITNDSVGYRGMSEDPAHPQGIGIYSEMSVYQLSRFRHTYRNYRIPFSQLPEAVQQCVIADCRPVTE